MKLPALAHQIKRLRSIRSRVTRQNIRADAVGDLGSRSLHRVPRQMRISRRGLDLRVIEQFPDHRQALAPIRRAEGAQQGPHLDPVRGELQGSLRYVTGADSMAVGTNEVYGPTHQFGDDNRNIPARPFLGFPNADDVLDIVENHLHRAASH